MIFTNLIFLCPYYILDTEQRTLHSLSCVIHNISYDISITSLSKWGAWAYTA